MSGNGQLIRSMRAGGGAGLAAAQELLRRAQSGSVSASELREVAKVVTLPELRDMFRDVAKDVSALLSDGREAVFRDVSSLTPDTERLTDARTMPERFLADLTLVEQELLNHPGMTRDQKAGRVFEFFESYATRFTELAHGEAQAAQAAQGTPAEQALLLAPKLNDAELTRALGQFDKALHRAGFEALRTSDGRTGAEAARAMLEAKTLDAQAALRPSHLEAPGWKDNPERSLKVSVDVERRNLALDARVNLQPQLRATPQKVDDPEEAKKRGRSRSGTDQVLGGNALWNVLHLLRGEELDDVARRDAMNALMVSAALLLILGGVLVGVLVAM